MSGSERPTAIEPSGVFQGLRPAAILFGVAFDNLATLLVAPLLLAAFAGASGPTGTEVLDEETLAALARSTAFLLASLGVGLGCTAAGAYVGARRAGCHFVRHGVWIGVCAALIGLACYPMPAAARPLPPLWFDLVGFALPLPVGALGGLLAAATSARGSAG
jgi:hypothetical protein